VDLGRERRILVAVFCNLKPKKILGVTSHGMLLACETREGRITLLTCDAEKRSEVYAEGVGEPPGRFS